jgi:glycosyltransferase involved in cell wall biosynthesis
MLLGKAAMKIYAIALVKNEADIIRENLKAAALWASKIIVYDNGSSDETWDIVQRMKSDVICPWKQEANPFYDGLRGHAFNAFKHELQAGDWWCILDADEFYIKNPRLFLPGVPSRFHFVCKVSADFMLCSEDLSAEAFTGRFSEDKKKIRYYSPFGFSEKRFFRHRSDLEWRPGYNLPHFIGAAYSRRIPVAHYQWRSPLQIQTRLQTRWVTLAQGYDGWDHFKQGENWRRYLKRRFLLRKWEEGKPFRLLWIRNAFRDWTLAYWFRLFLNWLGFWPRHRWLSNGKNTFQ